MFRNTAVKEYSRQVHLAKIVGMSTFQFRVLLRLICVCTVCICPTNSTLGVYGLIIYMPLYVLKLHSL